MKVLVFVGMVLAATLQADAHAIAIQDSIPKALKETMEQSASCALSLGAEAANLPNLSGIQQFPEDNPALNQLCGCIWEKKGIVNRQGDVSVNNLRKYLVDMLSIVPNPPKNSKELADELTESCKDVRGSDYRITSVKIQNCINKIFVNYLHMS